MTIPTRPAPAPPGSRAQNAAAGANASIEQLRLQLQQQQHLGSLQNINIKLPPPPSGGVLRNSNNNNINSNGVTRKFPQARYAPATNWDDDPFEASLKANGISNGIGKKMPPPRPPPPKLAANSNANSRKTNAPLRPPPHTTSTNILNSLFNKKKAQKATPASAAAKASAASRIYGVSSGYGSTSTASSSKTISSSNSNSGSAADWNACWDSVSTSTYNNNNNNYHSSSISVSHTNGTSLDSPQLISFDSPPSSPTFTQKSASDCLSVDSFSSDSNFSSPNNGSVSQPESGFEDDFSAAAARSRPPTTTPLDPWDTIDNYASNAESTIGTAPVRNLNMRNTTSYSGYAATSYSTSSITSSSTAHYGMHGAASTVDNPLCNGKSLLPPPPAVSMPTIIKPKVAAVKPKAPKPPGLLQFQQRHNGIAAGAASLNTPPSPPMPKFAPPPPPSNGAAASGSVSILDVIAGRADATQLAAASASSYSMDDDNSPPYGVALYDFEGVEVDDLSFRENEKIYLLEQVSAEWYRGRNRSGCEGLFPGNYIEIRVPLNAPVTAATSAAAPSNSPYSSAGIRVRCMYNFPAEVAGDLALREDEEVTVLYKINDDWLYGEVHGQQGQFPANFLEYVPANLSVLPA